MAKYAWILCFFCVKYRLENNLDSNILTHIFVMRVNKMSHIVYRTMLVGVLTLTCCACFAAPEPAIVPAYGQWTVDVEFTNLQQIILPTRDVNGRERYWYTIITLTNNTGADIDFYPKCDLMTDNFQILSEGTFVSPMVFQQIKKLHQSKYPFLENLETAGNRILQGSDNTKDIAVIWSDFKKDASGIKVFITGLSNETVVINHPIDLDENGRPVEIFLRKTLELSYKIKGDSLSSGADNLVFEGKRWIMR